MKKFKMKELRKTSKGQEFVVESIIECASIEKLLDLIKTKKLNEIVNDPFSIKEVKE